jgi:hypothetical protein
MTRSVVVLGAVVGLLAVAAQVGPAAAQDHGFALSMKLDALVDQLPAGRYKVQKSAIDATGLAIGKPLRDDHICIKAVGQVAAVVANYATTFDLSVMAWKAVGAKCKTAFHGDDLSAIHETACAGTAKMQPPSRWNVLEADPTCKFTYTETGREKSCSEVGAGMVKVATGTGNPGTANSVVGKPKETSSNHYLSGAVLVPGKSLRLHLREFDTSATETAFIAGHAVDVTLTATPCESSDRPATSLTD